MRELWLQDYFASSLVLLVEVDSFLDLMESKALLDDRCKFGLHEWFCTHGEFRILEERKLRKMDEKQVAFYLKIFANEGNGVYAGCRLL